MTINYYDLFWGRPGDGKDKPSSPGMLDLGLGIYQNRQAANEAEQRLRDARGPVYDQAMAGASGMLSAAGGFDPKAHAAERFNAQQALLAPKNEADYNQLMRSLHAKGLLGVSSFEPAVYGDGAVAPTGGAAMNPHVAAFYAARNAQRSKDAYGALGEGEKYLDNILNRSGMLTRQAGNVQSTGLEGQNTQRSRAKELGEMMRGGLGILRESGALKDIPGMFGKGLEFLGGAARNFWNPAPAFSVGDFSPRGYDSMFEWDWA